MNPNIVIFYLFFVIIIFILFYNTFHFENFDTKISTREVVCVDQTGNVVDSSLCTGNKPNTQKICMPTTTSTLAPTTTTTLAPTTTTLAPTTTTLAPTTTTTTLAPTTTTTLAPTTTTTTLAPTTTTFAPTTTTTFDPTTTTTTLAPTTTTTTTLAPTTTTTKAPDRCEGKWELPKCPTKCGYPGGTVYANWKVTKEGPNCPEKNLGPTEIKYGRTSKNCVKGVCYGGCLVITLYQYIGGNMDIPALKRARKQYPDRPIFITQGSSITGQVCAIDDNWLVVEQTAGEFVANANMGWGFAEGFSDYVLGQAGLVRMGAPPSVAPGAKKYKEFNKQTQQLCNCTIDN